MTVTAYTTGSDVVLGYLLYADNTDSATLNIYTGFYADIEPFFETFAGPNNIPAATITFYLRWKVTAFEPTAISGFQYGFPARYKFGNWRYTDVQECLGPITYIDTIQGSEDFPHQTWVVESAVPNNPFPSGSGGGSQEFSYILGLGDGGRAQDKFAAPEFSYELEPTVVVDFAIGYRADVGYAPINPGDTNADTFFYNY